MKKKITIEDLAGMVNKGFTEMEEKVEQLGTELRTEIDQLRTELRTETHEGFIGVNRRIDLLHEDISDISDIREELKDHDERLSRVERKVGSAK